MVQLSLFSADQAEPSPADLAGLLAASGQVVEVGGVARVSAVVADDWRADALAEMIVESGLDPQRGRSEEGSPVVGVAQTPALAEIAAAWTRGAVKVVPAGWVPGSRAVRVWALAAGKADGDCYLLGLDPHCPDSYAPLATAMMRTGVAPTLVGTRGARPALRVTGHRRLVRLAEMVGAPPLGALAAEAWPYPF
ncbi:hypothetical protein [Tsukamurella soli]|uniref:Uncharacterized protein n=1 Tax=Tsukamurella soli TaxID=644556 RepID=A0ABP8JCX6_9ACTN